MKLNIDVLMVGLLIVLIASFVAMLIYGEIWQVNLSTLGATTPLDIEHARIAFAFSCLGIASGTIMLCMMETRFSKNEKKQNVVSTSPHT
jgi:ABC-type Na+ efflux pump permease subunit